MIAEEIQWIDSQLSYPGWTPVAEIGPLVTPTIRTVGFVLREDDDAVLIAQCVVVGQEEFCHAMTIPKCCIRERRAL